MHRKLPCIYKMCPEVGGYQQAVLNGECDDAGIQVERSPLDPSMCEHETAGPLAHGESFTENCDDGETGTIRHTCTNGCLETTENCLKYCFYETDFLYKYIAHGQTFCDENGDIYKCDNGVLSLTQT